MDLSLELDAITIVVQLISTIVLFAAATIFLAKPMKKFMTARREFVDSELKRAQAVNDEALALKDAANDELAKIKAEADQMLADATEKARVKHEAILTDAKNQANLQIEKAEVLIARQRQEMLYDARQEIEKTTADIAAKIVKKEIDSQKHDDLFADFVKLIGGDADE